MFTPVLIGEIKYRLGKAKFHSLMIMLYSIASYYIVLRK